MREIREIELRFEKEQEMGMIDRLITDFDTEIEEL